MSNEIEIFKNEEFGEVRSMMTDGEVWFVGKDICKIFGDTNTNRSIGRIDNEDKIIKDIIDSMGRKQNITMVNESGLYSLLFQMQPQKANKKDGVSDAYPIETQDRIKKLSKFKHWITSDVLPTIRKTGGYVNDDELFVNTYLPFADQQTKSMFWQTLHTIRKQNEQITKQKEQLEHKQEIINGFCDIDVYTKRTIINRICKRTSTNNFATRWLELYHCFKETYHIDLSTRYHSYNIGKSNKDKCSSIIEYAELFGHIDNLYKCCVTLYEVETKKILQQILDAKGAK